MSHPASETMARGPSHEMNPVTLYQAGQDTVQDIIQNAQDIFQALKLTQFPNVPGYRIAQEKMTKLKEHLDKIEKLFKKLRVIYNECQEHSPQDQPALQTLVPLVASDREEQPKEAQPRKSPKEIELEKRKHQLEQQLFQKNEMIERLLQQMTELVWNTNSVLTNMSMN